MAFLHKALASVTFRRIWHEALDALQDLLWNEVLMRERFTTLGATQFYRDLTAVWAIIDEFIPDGSSSALGMPKLREGAQLLNLPIVARDGLMSLSSAYDRVYADNTEARKVIDELRFSTITYVDARLILQRRVEASD
jgi:RAD50-interacting protein 1